MYFIFHVLSYIIRDYVLDYPTLNIFNLPPFLTEILFLNVVFGRLSYHLAAMHYRKGSDPSVFGSFYYFIEYISMLGVLWLLHSIGSQFGIEDIYILLLTVAGVSSANWYVSNTFTNRL